MPARLNSAPAPQPRSRHPARSSLAKIPGDPPPEFCRLRGCTPASRSPPCGNRFRPKPLFCRLFRFSGAIATGGVRKGPPRRQSDSGSDPGARPEVPARAGVPQSAGRASNVPDLAEDRGGGRRVARGAAARSLPGARTRAIHLPVDLAGIGRGLDGPKSGLRSCIRSGAASLRERHGIRGPPVACVNGAGQGGLVNVASQPVAY